MSTADAAEEATGIRGIVSLVRGVIAVTREREVSFVAASVAYYAFVSLLPTLALAFVAASVVGGEAMTDTVAGVAGEFLTREAVSEALADAPGQGGLTVVGVALLLWGTTKIFRALSTAFAMIYGVDERPGFVGQIANSLLVIVAVGVGLVLMLVVGGVVASSGVPAVARVVSFLFLPALLTVGFLPMYYQFPPVETTVREALPGAVFAGVGWTVLQALFQVYVGLVGSSPVYGAIGAVLLLVTWLYFASQTLIVGVVVNVVLGDHHESPDDDSGRRARGGDRQLQQAGGRAFSPTDMSEDSDTPRDTRRETEPSGAPDISELEDRVEELRADLDAFEDDVRDRTVEKPKLQEELERYVRSRMRRGHARGWGPYLVLLYGVVLALGAFYLLSGGWAILAMVVTFLSTLGLYVVFVVVGIGLNILDVPGKAVDAVRERRE